MRANGSHYLADNPKPSGYHTEMENPRGEGADSASYRRQNLEAQLLRTTLKEVRFGDLDGAVASLQSLVALSPEEPSYRQLLDLARRQLEREGWYRFESKFYREDVDNRHLSGGRRRAVEPASLDELARRAPPSSPDELKLLRLKLSTWLSPGLTGGVR